MASNDDGGPEQAHAVGVADVYQNNGEHSAKCGETFRWRGERFTRHFCRLSRIGKITEASDVRGMK